VESDTNISVTIASLSEQLAEADKRMVGYRERTAKLLEGSSADAGVGEVSSDSFPLPKGKSGAVHGGDAAQQNDSPPLQSSPDDEPGASNPKRVETGSSLPMKSRVFNSLRQAHGREDLGEWRPGGMKDDTRPLSKAELAEQSKQDWVSKLL
jgi:hypothetical protein